MFSNIEIFVSFIYARLDVIYHCTKAIVLATYKSISLIYDSCDLSEV